jgi:hypothetical protein
MRLFAGQLIDSIGDFRSSMVRMPIYEHGHDLSPFMGVLVSAYCGWVARSRVSAPAARSIRHRGAEVAEAKV